MHQLADIHRVIRFLENKLDALPNANSREFAGRMVAALDAAGDSFHCSPKQARWLRRMAAVLGLTQEGSPRKPGSRLQELQEKRHKLLSRAQRERNKQEGADLLAISGMSQLRGHSLRRANAKIRHDKSHRRAFAVANPRKDEDE